MDELLPWQVDDWHRLQRWKQQNRIPHALLFVASPGIGQQAFARAWARSLLCQQPLASGQACQHCQACGWMAAKTHPDWHELSPEEDSAVIKIDAVRECQSYLNQSVHHGQSQIMILDPAEALPIASANALLKVLEEPKPGTYFILLSTAPSRLLATLKSRCQMFNLERPSASQSQEYLISRGLSLDDVQELMTWFPESPLLAADYYAQDEYQLLPELRQKWEQLSQRKIDPLTVATALLKLPDALGFTAITAWVEARIQQPDLSSSTVQVLFEFRDACYEWRRQSDQHNLNRQLLLERLCCRWYEINPI